MKLGKSFLQGKNHPALIRFGLLAFLTLQMQSAFGQSTFKPEWDFGVNAGETFSSIDFYPTIYTKLLDGKTFGVSARYISEKHFGLIGEVNYIQQGWKQDFVETDSIYAYSRSVNYIELPLLTHIYFGNKVRFIFNFGPKISFKISEKERMNTALSEILASADSTDIKIREQYGKTVEKNLDYGLVVGTGVELRTKVGKFVLEGRYYFGLGDIFNSSSSDYFSRSANRVISAKLTYYIKSF